MSIFGDFIQNLSNQWQQEIPKSEDIEGKRQQATKYYNFYNSAPYNSPGLADMMLKDYMPMTDKINSSMSTIEDLAQRISKAGWGPLATETAITALPSKELNDSLGASGIFKINPILNNPKIGIQPKIDPMNLVNSVLHEKVHYLASQPENSKILEEHRKNLKEFNETGNAFLDNYANDPEEIQARRLAETMIRRLYGMKNNDEIPEDRLLDVLLGVGQTSDPFNVQMKPKMW